MHVLITGHTGFKGAWLTVLLHELGHTVSGLSLDPDPGALYELAGLGELLSADLRVDIRDAGQTSEAIMSVAPDVVVHLAAQPLVRRSYREPRLTYETNVMGTYNVLEAASATPSIRALVIATTDKVYRNVNRPEGYREDEPLGGDDPYSSSKAMADLLTQSWVKSFSGPPIGIVRAGNVIGGGDVSADRLLVDLIEGFRGETPVAIRYPGAVRPWQHVLDCLNGYVRVMDALLGGSASDAWNIGPDERSFVTVREIADEMAAQWSETASWEDHSDADHLHEASLLALDAGKAGETLGWHDLIPYPESLAWTVRWAKSIDAGADPQEETREQVRSFLALRAKASQV